MHTNEASVFCFWKKSSDLQMQTWKNVPNDGVTIKDVSCDSSPQNSNVCKPKKKHYNLILHN